MASGVQAPRREAEEGAGLVPAATGDNATRWDAVREDGEAVGQALDRLARGTGAVTQSLGEALAKGRAPEPALREWARP